MTRSAPSRSARARAGSAPLLSRPVTTPTRRSWQRRVAAAGTASLLALTLAACGDDGDDRGADEPRSSSSSSPSPSSPSTEATEATETAEPTDLPTEGTTESAAPGSVPTEEELATALLTAGDLPSGFVEVPDDGASDDDAFDDTCFGEVGEFSDALGAEPDVEVERELSAEGQEGQGAVDAQLEAYADPTPVAPAFAAFTESLQSCTEISTTDADGITYDLRLSYDDTVDLPGAEDQLTVDLVGTIAAAEQEVPLRYRFVVALTGRFITLVGTYAVGEDTTGIVDATDSLAAVQAERLAQTFG